MQRCTVMACIVVCSPRKANFGACENFEEAEFEAPLRKSREARPEGGENGDAPPRLQHPGSEP